MASITNTVSYVHTAVRQAVQRLAGKEQLETAANKFKSYYLAKLSEGNTNDAAWLQLHHTHLCQAIASASSVINSVWHTTALWQLLFGIQDRIHLTRIDTEANYLHSQLKKLMKHVSIFFSTLK